MILQELNNNISEMRDEAGYPNEPFPLMKYIQVYLVATIVLYFIGPVEWKTRDPFITFFLVFLYQLFFYLGYNYSKRRISENTTSYFLSCQWFRRYYAIIAMIVLVVRFLYVIRVVYLYGFSDIGSLISTSLTSSSTLYYGEQTVSKGSEMFGGSLLSLLLAFSGPITIPFIPMSIITFRDLPLRHRILGLFAIVVYSFSKIVAGTSEGFFDILLGFGVGYFLKHKRILNRKEVNKDSRKKRIILFIFAIAILFAFNFVMSDRMGTYFNFGQRGENTFNLNNRLYSIMPEGVKLLLLWGTFYICQGYYGMSLCLTAEWTPMLGMGFSSYIRNRASSLLGINLSEQTLMAGAEKYGWIQGMNWHTAYSWIACDVWWIGVIPVMFILGRILFKSFHDAYYQRDVASVGMLYIMIMMAVFLPANNKVFANIETLLSFFGYLFIWLLKNRFKIKI